MYIYIYVGVYVYMYMYIYIYIYIDGHALATPRSHGLRGIYRDDVLPSEAPHVGYTSETVAASERSGSELKPGLLLGLCL